MVDANLASFSVNDDNWFDQKEELKIKLHI